MTVFEDSNYKGGTEVAVPVLISDFADNLEKVTCSLSDLLFRSIPLTNSGVLRTNSSPTKTERRRFLFFFHKTEVFRGRTWL